MQIAELYQLQPGTPVSSLQAIVKKCWPPKASQGQYGGSSQGGTLADASGEIDVYIFDGPTLQQGMSVMLTADAKGGCYTEVRQDQQGNQKLRLTVKGKVSGRVNILSGGTPAGYQQPQPQGQQGWGGQQPAGPGFAPQQGAWGQPQTPVLQQAPRQGFAPAQGSQGGQQAPAWAPKVKMTDRELRALLVRQFELICDDLAESLGTQATTLESELLGHCMAWATSVAIGVQKGGVELEKPAPAPQAALPPPQQGPGPEQWPGQVPGMQQGQSAPQWAPPAQPQGQQGWQQAPAQGQGAGARQRWGGPEGAVDPGDDGEIPF